MASQIISCPFCGQQFSVPAEQVSGYIDRDVPCSHCHGVFRVQREGEMLRGVMPQAAAMPPAPPTAYPAQPGRAYAQQSASTNNGIAIAGLVCGILGFFTCGIAGIAGLICSILGLKKSNQTGTGRGLATAGIIVSSLSLVMMLVLPSILLPSLARAREKANQVKCSSNLRQIGQAAMLYSQDYLRQGAPYGPNFQALVSTQMISTTTFDCPSDDSSGTGQLGSTKCSYIWLGQNLRMSSSPACVLAYEPLSNHGGEGCNILYADGHVEFMTARQAKPIIEQLEAGTNPPSQSAFPRR